MGITIDRALTLRDTIKSRVRDVFATARQFKYPHAMLVEDIGQTIYDSLEYRRLPGWAQGFIDGYISAQFERMYDLLEWRVFWRGRLVRSEEVEEGTWSECVPDKGAHVYRADPSRIY